MPERISSRQNPRVKTLVKLRERATRERLGRFVIEGARELRHAVEAGIALESLYCCPELFRADCEAVAAQAQTRAGEVFELSREAFEKASLREGPDGLLAVAPTWDLSPERLQLPQRPLLVLAEAVEKPGNLGAILRTADAAGADALLLCDPVADVFNPNVVRSSQGLVFRVPLAACSGEAARAFLAERGITPFATSPDADRSLWEHDYRVGTCFVLGSESEGLSDYWLRQATPLRIPMAGQADSLNVAASAAICLFEAARQRGLQTKI